MQIERVRHDWPEAADFTISRPNGYPIYTFLHFQTPVELEVDGQLLRTRPGACIFFRPGTPQFFHAPVPLIHNWIHVDESLSSYLQQYGIPEDTVLYPGETGFISEYFQLIEAEFFSESPYKQRMLGCFLECFLIRFSRALSDCTPAALIREPEKLQMRNVRKAILSHPEKHWTVAEMAAMAVMSQSRFHVAYKAYFGTSPMQDAIEAKLRYATTLLEQRRELTIGQIAQMLGYANEYHFIRLFKTAYGMPPGAYRKQHK